MDLTVGAKSLAHVIHDSPSLPKGSQCNEKVDNSTDAHAKNIAIGESKEGDKRKLTHCDDGEGVSGGAENVLTSSKTKCKTAEQTGAFNNGFLKSIISNPADRVTVTTRAEGGMATQLILRPKKMQQMVEEQTEKYKPYSDITSQLLRQCLSSKCEENPDNLIKWDQLYTKIPEVDAVINAIKNGNSGTIVQEEYDDQDDYPLDNEFWEQQVNDWKFKHKLQIPITLTRLDSESFIINKSRSFYGDNSDILTFKTDIYYLKDKKRCVIKFENIQKTFELKIFKTPAKQKSQRLVEWENDNLLDEWEDKLANSEENIKKKSFTFKIALLSQRFADQQMKALNLKKKDICNPTIEIPMRHLGGTIKYEKKGWARTRGGGGTQMAHIRAGFEIIPSIGLYKLLGVNGDKDGVDLRNAPHEIKTKLIRIYALIHGYCTQKYDHHDYRDLETHAKAKEFGISEGAGEWDFEELEKLLVEGASYMKTLKEKWTKQIAEENVEDGDANVEDGVASGEDGDANVEDGDANVEDGAASVEGEVASVEGEVASVEGEVASVEGEVASVEGEVASVEGEVASIEGEVASVEGEVASVEGEVASVEGEVASVEGEVASIEDGAASGEDGEEEANIVEILHASSVHMQVNHAATSDALQYFDDDVITKLTESDITQFKKIIYKKMCLNPYQIRYYNLYPINRTGEYVVGYVKELIKDETPSEKCSGGAAIIKIKNRLSEEGN